MRPEQFQIHVPECELEDLERRLGNTKLPEDFGNETWCYGTEKTYLQSLLDYWLHDYNWRDHEAKMNRFAHYRVVIDDVPIHFIHHRSGRKNAIPLIMTHGWPWTFWDFQHVIEPLANPAAYGGNVDDAFDIIVPSLPGYAFSSPLRKAGVSAKATADLWHKLMTEVLGYEKYAAHGGDWGGYVTGQIGYKYPDHLIGIHMINAAPLDWNVKGLPGPEEYAPEEAGWCEQTHRYFADHQGYYAQQGTKPQTLAYGLSDSPAGLCAWLLEKRRSWSDCGGDVERRYSKDDLLTSIMLYWVTNTIGTSIRMYYESGNDLWQPPAEMPTDGKFIRVPTGILKLEKDLVHFPRAAVEHQMNVQRWTNHAVGGHFAPFEEPQLVIDELRGFFAPYRAR
jgi:pimeloyl-ACP methyl ester carboxylesterase